jgi:hypothetical protein
MIFFCLGNKKRCFIETPSSPSKLLDNRYIHREFPPGSLSPGRPGRGGHFLVSHAPRPSRADRPLGSSGPVFRPRALGHAPRPSLPRAVRPIPDSAYQMITRRLLSRFGHPDSSVIHSSVIPINSVIPIVRSSTARDNLLGTFSYEGC